MIIQRLYHKTIKQMLYRITIYQKLYHITINRRLNRIRITWRMNRTKHKWRVNHDLTSVFSDPPGWWISSSLLPLGRSSFQGLLFSVTILFQRKQKQFCRKLQKWSVYPFLLFLLLSAVKCWHFSFWSSRSSQLKCFSSPSWTTPPSRFQQEWKCWCCRPPLQHLWDSRSAVCRNLKLFSGPDSSAEVQTDAEASVCGVERTFSTVKTQTVDRDTMNGPEFKLLICSEIMMKSEPF